MVALKDFKNDQEVAEHMKQTGRKYVIFEGSVYDVTDYIGVHPGGTDKIEPYVGKSIDEPFDEAEHSRSARNLFRDLDKVGIIYGNDAGIVDNAKISSNPNIKGLDGTILESKIKLDYSKGLFWQLLTLEGLNWDDYIQFINEPKHLVNPVREIRLFDNPILEYGVCTPWYYIPIAYLPPIIYCYYLGA